MIDPLIRAKSYFTDIEILGGSLEESTWGFGAIAGPQAGSEPKA